MFGRYRSVKVIGIAVAVGLLVFLARSSAIEPWRNRLMDLVIGGLGSVRHSGGALRQWFGGGSAKKIQALEQERTQLL